MNEYKKTFPRDYFLTNYEKDLLTLTLEEAMRKYPLVPSEKIRADVIELHNLDIDRQKSNNERE